MIRSLLVAAALGFAIPVIAAPSAPRFTAETGFLQLPDNWVLGEITAVAVDRRDGLWIMHRPYTLSEADKPHGAPAILAFDKNGRFLRAFGGPSDAYQWPATEHTIAVDGKDRIWAAGIFRADPSRGDDMLLQFDSEGRFLRQIGKRGGSRGNGDTANFRAPADVFIDDAAHEIYVADGYANSRVIVLDSETGAFKRMWGAFGKPPVDGAIPSEAEIASPEGPQRLNNVHCVEVSRDGLVYVADRNNKRIQIFTRAGKFVRQVFVQKDRTGKQTAAGLAFSPDRAQRYLYVSIWSNAELLIYDRKSMTLLGTLATPGRGLGEVDGPHLIASDSRGRIYVAEVLGRRVQRFTPQR